MQKASEPMIETENKSPFLPKFFRKPVSPLISIIVLAVIILATSAFAVYYLTAESTRTLPYLPTTKPLTLSVESPKEGTVILGNKAVIKGKTLPNSLVVFFTETDENSVESDANGQFEGEITLTSGINTLTVTVWGENGQEKTETLDLVYDEQVMGAKTESKQPPGQAKKEETTQQATVGNIEQITPRSVIIQEKRAKKKTEVILDKNTQIINQDKKTLRSSALKPKDLAAIISTESGTTNGQKTKKIFKIFVRQASSSAQLKQLKRQAIQGIIAKISGNNITLTHQIQRERVYTLLVNAQTVIKIKGIENATLANLGIGQRIAAVGDRNEEGLLIVKRIHVIPGKATGIFEKSPLSTPSAALTPTSTPSATPTITPSPTEALTPTPTVTP